MKKTEEIKIAIIGSNFQREITDALEEHCIDTLLGKGIRKEQILSVRVPGSLEIPLAAKKLAEKNKFDALIAIGAIHKGETYHFEQVADQCIRGCMDVSWQYGIPVIYEVLAVYNIEDARKRATREEGNRGQEAALAALSMIDTIAKI